MDFRCEKLKMVDLIGIIFTVYIDLGRGLVELEAVLIRRYSCTMLVVKKAAVLYKPAK